MENLAEKIAEKFGFSSNFQDSSKNVETEVDKSILGAKSFAEFLNYKYFDDDLFINGDGSAGFLIKLSPIVGSDENHIKNLELFFNDELPLGGYLSFCLIASNDIDPILNVWKDGRVSYNQALKNLETSREGFLRETANNYIDYSGTNARNFKLYLSYVEKKPDIKKLKIFLQSLRQKLETLELAPAILGVEDLIYLVREILEVNFESTSRPKANICKYNKNRFISDQILTPGKRIDILDDRIEHRSTDLTSRSYFALSLPSEFSLNEMITLLGDSSRAQLSIPGRFIINYVIANNLNKASQNAIISKGNRVIEASEQWYSRNNRNLIREAVEWKDVNDRAKNGEKFLNEYFQVTLTTKSGLIEQAEQNLYSLYNLLGWRLELNEYFQFPALLTCLPFHAHKSWTYFDYYKLTKTALSSEVIAKLPIHGEWRGVPEPGMLLQGRRGQLFHFNQFYRISSGNYNVCVFGPSGSGKSVFLQEMTTCLMAQDCKVFILDIGRSFKNICELLDGEFIQFGAKSDIVLNPFVGFDANMSEEDRLTSITYAKAIIASMCNATGDVLKESIIEKAIKSGLEEYGSSLDITILADIIKKMGKEDASAGDIALNISLGLYSYTSDGMWGKFFSPKKDTPTPNKEQREKEENKELGKEKKERKETKFEKQITVFEFEEIKNRNLLAVVLQIISMQIFMQVLTSDRSKRFVLIVDEAWRILDYSAQFLAELARTFRKYGGSLVVCVQNFNDMQGSDHHRSVLENSTWTVLLKQDEKGLHAFKNSEAFKDMLPLIKSISVVPGKYSESLIYTTGVKVIGRLMLDNYSKILYSTDSHIYKSLNDLVDGGMPISQAVAKIAEFKYGK